MNEMKNQESLNFAQKILEDAEHFAQENLSELCSNLITLQNTGILVDSKFRELENILKELTCEHKMSLTITMIQNLAVREISKK